VSAWPSPATRSRGRGRHPDRHSPARGGPALGSSHVAACAAPGAPASDRDRANRPSHLRHPGAVLTPGSPRPARGDKPPKHGRQPDAARIASSADHKPPGLLGGGKLCSDCRQRPNDGAAPGRQAPGHPERSRPSSRGGATGESEGKGIVRSRGLGFRRGLPGPFPKAKGSPLHSRSGATCGAGHPGGSVSDRR